MASAEIYKNNTLISVEYFKREFTIVESLLGELFWDTGESPNPRSGVIKTWIQMADTTPRIVTVLPDWKLIIDGAAQDEGFYDVIENLADKNVELQHHEYRFLFNFTKAG